MSAGLVSDLPAAGSALAGRVVVCSTAQLRQWAGATASPDASAVPALARRVREQGALAVCVVGVDPGEGRRLTWLDTPHGCGWLAAAVDPEAAGDVRRFAANLSEALGRGFVAADAAVVATMAGGAETRAYITDPRRLPLLSWGEAPVFAAARPSATQWLGLYALVDSAARMEQVLAAGVRTVQLRIKTPDTPDAAWHAMLRAEVRRSIELCVAAGAELYVNDHWQLAAELGAFGVHLGQEDLVALGDAGRAKLQATGLALGVSSHSLWELCRALALAPRYVACGPVWPTLTKAMPWVAQGMDNLTWWCRIAGVPVVAIGGILGPEEVRQAARCGAAGVCIVRGLGEHPGDMVPPLQAALEAGRREHREHPPAAGWPHPSLRPA